MLDEVRCLTFSYLEMIFQIATTLNFGNGMPASDKKKKNCYVPTFLVSHKDIWTLNSLLLHEGERRRLTVKFVKPTVHLLRYCITTYCMYLYRVSLFRIEKIISGIKYNHPVRFHELYGHSFIVQFCTNRFLLGQQRFLQKNGPAKSFFGTSADTK